jgi:trigger factor
MSFTVATEPRADRQLAVTIEVAQDRVQQELRKAAAKIARDYRIPGFRRGKAPYHIVVQQFGLANLYSEFIDDLGQELFDAALKQENIQPYAQSTVEDVQLEPLVYKLVVPLEPKVVLSDYRSLRLEEDKADVDDAEVTRRIETYREQYSSWQDVERPSQYGDMMTIDVRSVLVPAPGEEDAEEVVVLDETDWDVTPDEENPMEPPGFDAELLGLKAGDEKVFFLDWPADSQSIYAGKQARFQVKVASIQAYEKPELNDAFAQLVGPDYETLEDLKRSIRETIETGEKNRLENEFVNKALDAVVDISTLEYPPAVVEDQIDRMVQDTDTRLRQLGVEGIEFFLRQTNRTMEDYRTQLRPEATKIARRNLVISELVTAESIQVSDEEIEERILAMVRSDDDEELSESVQSLIDVLRQGSGRTMIVSQILMEKTVARLLAIVRGEEVPAREVVAAPVEMADAPAETVEDAAE